MRWTDERLGAQDTPGGSSSGDHAPFTLCLGDSLPISGSGSCHSSKATVQWGERVGGRGLCGWLGALRLQHKPFIVFSEKVTKYRGEKNNIK